MLLIGLGVHSIFEGIALGVEDKDSAAFFMALAIFIHKGFAGMSLAISLMKAFPTRDSFVIALVAFFAIFTPLGVTIGLIIKNELGEIYEIVFACLSAGTFVYISCSEIIVEEFSRDESKIFKIVFFLLGCASIGALHFIPGS